MENNIAAIILAAGKGSRMNAKKINKVVMTLAGKPIIAHAITLLNDLNIKTIIVVVGFAKESVMNALHGGVIFAEQKKRLGTAHAAYCGFKKLPKGIKHVLILNGDDSAFYADKLIDNLIKHHFSSQADLTFLTVEKNNPESFGRVVRDENGELITIMEEKNATEEIKKIKEINAGSYVCKVEFLAKYLPQVRKNAISKEYYLPDIIELGLRDHQKVLSLRAGEIAWWGINTTEELAEAQKYKETHNLR